jgi:hypothetical protein
MELGQPILLKHTLQSSHRRVRGKCFPLKFQNGISVSLTCFADELGGCALMELCLRRLTPYSCQLIESFRFELIRWSRDRFATASHCGLCSMCL